jgi:Protein of unknown function (DUF1573)
MSDDFGTVNLRRGERAREIEVLRQHYRQHREALARMTGDAPTEHLAGEYQRLIIEIDRALGKLNELEGAGAEQPRLKTEPGMRPLVAPPNAEDVEMRDADDLPMGDAEPRSRVPLILAAAVLALAAIGWLIWRASSDRDASPAIVTEGATSAPVSTAPDTAVEEPPAPVQQADPLAAAPTSRDYGTIRKGTRATRQFEISNSSNDPVSITVARSACRCLYYEHAPVIPPKAKETLTVTIDGAKAKAGALRESVKISAKSDPAVATAVEINATIQ